MIMLASMLYYAVVFSSHSGFALKIMVLYTSPVYSNPRKISFMLGVFVACCIH